MLLGGVRGAKERVASSSSSSPSCPVPSLVSSPDFLPVAWIAESRNDGPASYGGLPILSPLKRFSFTLEGPDVRL